MKRKIYLRMKTLSEAKKIILESHPWPFILSEEQIPTRKAKGRITARPIFAKYSLPSFNAAAMDGFAVKAEETYKASDTNPLFLKLGKQAIPINTGEAIPSGTNAVIMIEDVHFPGEDLIEIRAPVYPWQHVRKIGEDIVAGELLFTAGHRLAPWDLGALLAAGHLEVLVKERPKVIIIPTGDELIAPEEVKKDLPEGKSIEINSTILASLVEEWGGEAEILPIVPDDLSRLETTLKSAISKHPHLIAILAGSSAGSKDYTASLIEEHGQLLFHGVSMMPGKPVVYGLVEDTPVIGVPGYPVSAVIAFEQLMRPVFEAMFGASLPRRPEVKAISGRKLPSRLGITEFVRVKVGKVKEKTVFLPLKRGAGVITTLTRADGVVLIPEDWEGVVFGQELKVELLRSERDLAYNILVVGSHDLGLDLLTHFLHKKSHKYELSLTHVGSLSGLIAVREELAHMAGTHLFDPETEEFNLPYIRKYLPNTPVKLVHFAWRDQGLIVLPGNPKGIYGLQDLIREDVYFINRQPGSGTRVLLDYHLKKFGIPVSKIAGYKAEETTHVGVAVAVATGQADVGLGIKAAAKLLGLEFIPLFQERYDLLVREDFFGSEAFGLIREILSDEDFRSQVAALGGYEISEMGKILL